MIRSVELELKTVSEANSRFASRGGMFLGAARHAEQRDTVRAALNEQFGPPPLFSVLLDGWTRANPIEITLTRMAPGELDPDENLPVSQKYVKDEIAAWFGVNDRDQRLRWSYAQERTSPGIYKVRIEIADATPGEDIRVQLSSEAEANGARLRPLVKVKRGGAADVVAGQAELVIMKCYAAIPWEQPACLACGGRGRTFDDECKACKGTGRKGNRLAPLARFDGLDNPPSNIDVRVPAEHLGRWPGTTVKLHRRRFKSASTGLCWLFEERTIPR